MHPETTESVEEAFAIRRVVVIGAGTMGHGIAHVCAAAGCEVWLNDVSAAAIDAGLAKIQQNLAVGVQKGKLTQEAADATRARLHGEPDLRVAASLADLVVEAALHPETAPEDQELSGLSPREREVLTLIAEGRTGPEIAKILGISAHTANRHRANLMEKLHLHNKTDLVKLALRLNVVQS